MQSKSNDGEVYLGNLLQLILFWTLPTMSGRTCVQNSDLLRYDASICLIECLKLCGEFALVIHVQLWVQWKRNN